MTPIEVVAPIRPFRASSGPLSEPKVSVPLKVFAPVNVFDE
jgi:hypothetical protein